MIWLQWYLLGMLTIVSLLAYRKLERHFILDWKANLGLFGAFVLFWLTFGWSWASFAEGESQSGAMGLLIFGLSGLVVSAVTWRQFIASSRR
ncbi:hypothetical protein SAMN04488540_10180 [Ferrimonas sediminum]|uniref:Uncharacterized protein n=1 Tax=Ferrimonas sediminum TaxID=718193 RepID=A0A1G8JM46_9GAMM|nr:tetrachloroethene dehalogenase [Ferrimonas sediminum]SDI31720.1 hypothetical protein SAMN04488540_10180 [Ferrimonas sediminum]